MRILLVNSAIPTMWGGGEKWFVEAARWFIENGHEPILVGRPDSRLLATAARCGIEVREFGFGGDFDPVASWRAGRLIRRERPQVVLVNFNKDAWLFGRGASLFGVPLVARHGLMAFKGKVHYRLLHRWHIGALVVNAPTILERYDQLGFDVSEARVILNGVRLPELQRGEMRRRYGIGESAPLVVTAGRLAKQKCLDRFVSICGAIAERHEDARFIVMGDGAVREDLERWIEEAGLQDRFTLPGFVDDYAAIASDADLFLLTSKNEGTPNALLETMAAGTCSLSFDVGSVPDVLADDLRESMFKDGDTDAMQAKALALMTDADARHDLARRQQQRIVDRFTFDQSMRRYEVLLTGMIH